MRHKMK